MILQLTRVHFVFGIVGWILVKVGQEDSLTIRGFDMFPRAAIAVSTGANLVIETTIDLILFGAEDGSKIAVDVGLAGV